LLRSACPESVPRDRLWVNPDCGLKTRSYDDVGPALAHLVAAARRIGIIGAPGAKTALADTWGAEGKIHAHTAAKRFADLYAAKFAKAVAKITRRPGRAADLLYYWPGTGCMARRRWPGGWAAGRCGWCRPSRARVGTDQGTVGQRCGSGCSGAPSTAQCIHLAVRWALAALPRPRKASGPAAAAAQAAMTIAT
jgi:Cobalamin-independent synthase, Catalytic domain